MLFFAVFFSAFAAQPQWPVVLKGVLEGFGLTTDLDEMKDCLASSEDDIKDVQEAIALLEKKDATDVLNGLGKLGQALENLPTVVGKCEAAAKDVKDEAPKLVEALEALKHPKAFVFHVGKDLIVNHADIFSEVSAAIDAYHAQNFEECGKSTGEALSKLLVGEMSLTATVDKQWPVVLKGVLEGFGLTKDLDLMQNCLAKSEDGIQDVQEAIELLEKKDATDVLNGLGKLGSALELLPKVVDTCDDAAKDVKDEAPKLFKALEALKHPKSFVFHVGKDLVVNHADIFSEVSAAIDAYHAQNFEECGKSTGEALSKLLVGEAAAGETLIV
jgi:hydroxypyruvate isomerase